MRSTARVRYPRQWTLSKLAIVVSVLLLAFLFGANARVGLLLLLFIGIGFIVQLRRPVLGVLALIPIALVVTTEFGTGTAVVIYVVVLIVPILLVLWVLYMASGRNMHLVRSRTNRPLMFFLLAGLVSLLIGNAFWDPGVPRSSHFVLVQLAQWGILAFSGGAFWLAGNLIDDEVWLSRLTFLFLGLAGCLAILYVIPSNLGLITYVQFRATTQAFSRAPFWVLLVAVAGGQLLFNQRLSIIWRILCLASIVAAYVYAFYHQREALSNWIGIVAVTGILLWLRWRRLRWIILILVALGVVLFFPSIYEFAGGDAEWAESGGSRLVLIERVVEVTMRNPITGLGPAAYRAYARMKPLPYRGAHWVDPQISSHNNYVDIFSYTGLLGLGLFIWFLTEVGLLAWRLSHRFRDGFSGGYANGMMAAWVGTVIIMLLADWFLPFVYNISFAGFQASVLVWLFLGGLIVLEQISRREDAPRNCDAQPQDLMAQSRVIIP